MSAGNSFELPAAFFIGNIVTVQKPLSAFIFKYCLKHGSDKRLDEKQLREKGKWKIQTHQFDPVCKQSKQMIAVSKCMGCVLEGSNTWQASLKEQGLLSDSCEDAVGSIYGSQDIPIDYIKAVEDISMYGDENCKKGKNPSLKLKING